MNSEPIFVVDHNGTLVANIAYEVAGQLIVSSEPIAMLDAFRCQLPSNISLPQPDKLLSNKGSIERRAQYLSEQTLIYRGEGAFAGGMQTVSMYHHGEIERLDNGHGLFLLEVANQRQAVIQPDQGLIYCLHPAGLSDSLNAEILLGPVLLLLLASRGIFCLHASAVSIAGQAVVFIGESGQGKSTLASVNLPADWSRLTDDITPVQIKDDGVYLLTDFPQLKLSSQTISSVPSRLSAVFQLGATTEQMICEPLALQQTVLLAARHTAASRVFSPLLLKNHLAFCTQLGQRISLQSLSYPRQITEIGELRRFIQSYI